MSIEQFSTLPVLGLNVAILNSVKHLQINPPDGIQTFVFPKTN